MSNQRPLLERLDAGAWPQAANMQEAAARIRELEAENHHLMNSAELMRKELSGVYAGTHSIVPVEPTPEMIEAGQIASIDAASIRAIPEDVYRAMIRAAQWEQADETRDWRDAIRKELILKGYVTSKRSNPDAQEKADE